MDEVIDKFLDDLRDILQKPTIQQEQQNAESLEVPSVSNKETGELPPLTKSTKSKPYEKVLRMKHLSRRFWTEEEKKIFDEVVCKLEAKYGCPPTSKEILVAITPEIPDLTLPQVSSHFQVREAKPIESNDLEIFVEKTEEKCK